MRAIKIGLLWICWTIGLFHLARYFSRDKLRILCYHGFDNDGNSRFRPKLLMNGGTFRERLALLSRYRFNVLSLDEALKNLRNGVLAPDSLVITIDDGFYSTFSVAAPALESHGYPATVYVTTYYVEQQTPIFNLVVDYLLWRTQRSSLELRGVTWGRDQRVNLLDPNERERFSREVNESIQRCDTSKEREAICKELAKLLEQDYEEINNNRTLSLMSLDEIRDLSNRGMDIQLHTHRHRLPAHDAEASSKEVRENRSVLEAATNSSLKHFCYPSGLWSNRHWSMLSEMGIESATTCERGLNNRDTPILALRRIVDGEDVSKIEFLSEIFGFSCLLRRMHNCIRWRKAGVSIALPVYDAPGDDNTFYGAASSLSAKEKKQFNRLVLWCISTYTALFGLVVDGETSLTPTPYFSSGHECECSQDNSRDWSEFP